MVNFVAALIHDISTFSTLPFNPNLPDFRFLAACAIDYHYQLLAFGRGSRIRLMSIALDFEEMRIKGQFYKEFECEGNSIN